MFKQVGECQGINAWRCIIRLIDSSRGILLEQLRNQVMMTRAFPIKSLKGVTVGIAEYENKISDFVESSGRQPPEDDRKSDSNAILPTSWAITGLGVDGLPSALGRALMWGRRHK